MFLTQNIPPDAHETQLMDVAHSVLTRAALQWSHNLQCRLGPDWDSTGSNALQSRHQERARRKWRRKWASARQFENMPSPRKCKAVCSRNGTRIQWFSEAFSKKQNKRRGGRESSTRQFDLFQQVSSQFHSPEQCQQPIRREVTEGSLGSWVEAPLWSRVDDAHFAILFSGQFCPHFLHISVYTFRRECVSSNSYGQQI